MAGIVSTDRSVVISTPREQVVPSMPYSAASIMGTLPIGMAIIKTVMPRSISGTGRLNRLRQNVTRAGTSNSFIKENR